MHKNDKLPFFNIVSSSFSRETAASSQSSSSEFLGVGSNIIKSTHRSFAGLKIILIHIFPDLHSDSGLPGKQFSKPKRNSIKARRVCVGRSEGVWGQTTEIVKDCFA